MARGVEDAMLPFSYRNPSDLARIEEDLTKAGLPE